KITNLSETSNLKDVQIQAYIIDMSNLSEETKKNPSISRDKALNEYLVSAESGIKRKGGAYKFKDKEKESFSEGVEWVGFRDRYYCALIRPSVSALGYFVDPIQSDLLKITYSPQEVNIGPEESENYSSVLYFGPENLDLLKGYDLGFEKVRRYYRFGLFDAIAKAIYQIMHLLHKVIPNWGVSILLISVVIYFSMYPLTMKSMTSMKKMQSLQPKLAKLREKHKNNPQKLNKEMMGIYKENGVNPLGGCLPMVFQMPVFIGLYQVLWRDVSFKGASFLWIKDLSQPDRLFLFPSSLPFIGNEFNLLPIVMIVVMFFQMKLSSKNMVATDPAQIAQQKMMGSIMPVFMGVIFYRFASGLTLYFTMFYMFSTFTQWKITKKS
ncbi:Inner membrane protein translocase and chaperone YidC, long form, partial [hydrothermal vent metagenome]